MIAYHFVGKTLRDGRPVPKNGVWLKHDGPLEMCKIGLHASKHPSDALKYAPGPILCKVELRGTILSDTDKVVADQRKIIARIDATKICRDHARWCALSVVHLWDCPKIVREYLTTGEESIRAAAEAAAWAAAEAAAEAAAWGAAEAAAEAAARAAAWGAAAAAEAAAWGAAEAAQRKHFMSLVKKEFSK